MYEQFEALNIDCADGVVRVTLNNPPLNPVTPQLHYELSRVFKVINDDPRAQVVVLTGAGDRGFSAGGDIKNMAKGLDDHIRWSASMREARDIVTSMLACDVPIIARINGHAVGMGTTLALCADITVMAEGAKIGDTHVKIGLAAGDGGALLWPPLVGLVAARRFLLGGDLLSAREAFEAGLLTEVAAREELDARVQLWVDKFLNTPSLALRYTKRALNTTLLQQVGVYMDAHLGLETLTHLSADHREAVTALVEGRPPAFQRG
jgi:enoyl-CoA hydratase